MIMRASLVLLTASLWIANATAQVDIGAKAGLNYNIWSAAKGSQYPPGFDDPESSNGVGFHLGAYFNIGISDKVAFRPEVLFSTRGVKETEDETDTFTIGNAQITERTNGDGKIKASYIEVPLLLAIMPAEGFGIHVGPVAALRMGWNFEYDYTITTTTTIGGDSEVETLRLAGSSATDTGVRGLDLGLALGFAYEFENGLNLGFRYTRGLTTVNDNKQNGVLGPTDFVKYNQNIIQLSVGFTFVKN